MSIEHDSAPVTAYFRDRESAELCLRELRQSGILNEQIGVAYADATVISPATIASSSASARSSALVPTGTMRPV